MPNRMTLQLSDWKLGGQLIGLDHSSERLEAASALQDPMSFH